MKRSILLVAISLALVAAVAAARFWTRDPIDVTTSSEQAYDLYREGRAEYRRFRWHEGVALLEQAVAADPDFALAHLHLASGYEWTGRGDEADAAREKAYALVDGVTELERLEIEYSRALHEKRYDDVLSLFEQLAEEYPDHPFTLFQRARMALRLEQDFEKAEACYLQILAQDPVRVDMHNNLGYLYLEQGEYEKALQSLRRYAFYAPDQANPHDSLGEALYYTGHYEEAIEELLTSIEIDPRFVHSVARLAEVLTVTGQFKAAQKVLEDERELFEDMDWMDEHRRQRLHILWAGQRWQALLAEAEESLAAAQKNEAYEYVLGFTIMRMYAQGELGDLASAQVGADSLAAHAKRMVAEQPPTPWLEDWVRLGAAWSKCFLARAHGQPAAGLESLRAALGKSPKSPHLLADYRYELARACYEAGEYEEAVREGNELLAVIPKHPFMNLLVCKAYVQLDQRDHALDRLTTYFEVMAKADEGHPDVDEALEIASNLVIAN